MSDKVGHVAKKCKTKVHKMNSIVKKDSRRSEREAREIYMAEHGSNSILKVNNTIDGIPVCFELDGGANSSVLASRVANKLAYHCLHTTIDNACVINA